MYSREDSGEGCDLELWGWVQVDVRARREQQGIKWLFSTLSERCSSSRKLVVLTRRP